MSIRTRIAQTFESITKLFYGVGESADASFSIYNTFGNYADTKRLGKYKGIVFAAVNLISDEMAKYQPVFNKDMDGHLEPIKGHYLINLFKKPNKDTSQADFFKAVSVYKNIIGESFWYTPLGEVTGLPKELYLLPPDKMGIKTDEKGEVIGYALRKSDGTEVLFKPEEIMHPMTFNPSNPYRGYGIVEAALDYIETEEGARQFSKNFFRNSGTPSGILSVKADIGKESFRKFAQRWREQHEGTNNAGRIAIIRSSEVEFTKMSLGLNEIDMKILKDLTIGEVLMMFRVPKSLLGIETEQGLGRASVESLEYIFAKRTIEPEMQLLDKTIQRMLERFFPREQLTVTHENIIPPDKVFELEERKAAVDVWVTRDEIRQEDGLEDLPGGEFLRAAFTTMPLDGSETAPAPVVAPTKMLVKLTKTVKKKTLSIETKERFRLTLQRKQRTYERRFATALAPVLEKQQNDVLKKWKLLNSKGVNGIIKAVQDHLLDIPEATKAFENALFPVQLTLAQDQGKIALLFAGMEDAEFEVTGEVQKFIRDAISKMSYQFNEQTLKDLGQIVIAGMQEGKGVSAIARDLSGAYSDIRGYRAERLARTETHRASNASTRLAYKQTGYVDRMEWYANPGACADCESLSGTQVGLDENFLDLGDTIGDTKIDYLPVQDGDLHPNCECTIIPVRD